MSGPFAAAADDLADAGWFPLPLPARKKTPPPKGTTGKASPFPDAATLAAWLSTPEHRAGNVGVRLGDDQVGIDVDAHSGKPGGDTLAELEAKLGPLPPTYVSTARRDGRSGIRHYRIPAGVEFPGELKAPSGTKAIEFIQWFHRYAVVPPSVHPDTGDCYVWIGPDGELLDKPPRVEDLPELPTAWIEYFRRDRPTLPTADKPPADRPQVSSQPAGECDLEPVAEGDASAAVRSEPIRLGRDQSSDPVDRVLGRFVRELNAGRHPAARDVTLALERLRERKYPGAEVAGDTARTLFVAAVTRHGSGNVRTIEQAGKEWDDLVAGARSMVEAEQGTAPAYEPGDAERGDVAANLPDEFWSARPVLEHVRRAAWARVLSADAVFAAVLVRAAWLTDHRIVLPAIVGGYGTLNLMAGVVGPSGTGKGSAFRTAGELLGEPPCGGDYKVREVPAGSGEGVTAAFLEQRPVEGRKGATEWVQACHGVLLRVDEGEVLGKLGDRAGSTLWTVWRSGWSGETLGFSNASADRRRPVIPALGYRLCALVAIQPGLADAILADTEGGTPQRFLWVSTFDPAIPDAPEDWPGPLDWRPPRWDVLGEQMPMVHGRPKRVLEVDPVIVAELQAAHRAKVRGGGGGIYDGHRGLNMLKVAGVLAVLEGRLEINAEDWQLAGIVVDTSDAVRERTAEAVRAVARRTAQGRIEFAGQRAEAEEIGRSKASNEIARVAKVVAGYVARKGADGGVTRRDISRAVGRDHGLVDAALALAEATGLVVNDGTGRYFPPAVSDEF